MSWYSFPNRTMCDVLAEMRKILNLLNASRCDSQKVILLSMVEEIQVYGNRMEAGLSDQSDARDLHDKRKELKNTVNKLEDQVKDLEQQVNDQEEKLNKINTRTGNEK